MTPDQMLVGNFGPQVIGLAMLALFCAGWVLVSARRAKVRRDRFRRMRHYDVVRLEQVTPDTFVAHSERSGK
jgi:hypothetical protein